ncbi:MAG: membrane protein insertion efficiency factor YidD [Sedimentisphaerales bacterium]|nr:membrane protein insertion efficiency factor YidD [Sedimentisphaerales bacterium]
MVWLLQKLIRFYQLAISPWLPNACRFTPSCSAYAMEALARHGVLRGMGLTLWRIMRCHPWSKGGYDPVPD